MNPEDKPISELISSETPVDTITPPIGVDIPAQQPSVKPKKSKAFPIVVGILLLLILGIGGYYVYTNYLGTDDVVDENQQQEATDTTNAENPQESTDGLGGIETLLIGQDKVLLMTAPTSACDDTGFVETAQSTSEYMLYEDNQNGFCSSSHKVEFFLDEGTMTTILSKSQTTYPLKEITIDGVDYEYILKEDYDSQSGIASGIAYIKEPTLEVGGYEAFRVLSFYKVFPEGTDASTVEDSEVIQDGTTNTLCVFDLSKIETSTQGYVLFSGSASAGSEVDYCEVLENTEGFEIKIL